MFAYNPASDFRSVAKSTFSYAGCRIVARWSPPASTRRYRGLDRIALGSSYVEGDGHRPSWLDAFSDDFSELEDIFELIPNSVSAERLYDKLSEYDAAWELIACSVCNQVLQELASNPSKFLGYVEGEPERTALMEIYERLAAHPAAPDWPILGYDVATFGSFNSAVLLELSGPDPVAPALNEHRAQLNESQLFSTPGAALAFLQTYLLLPHHEEGEFFVYEIRGKA